MKLLRYIKEVLNHLSCEFLHTKIANREWRIDPETGKKHMHMKLYCPKCGTIQYRRIWS